MLVQGVDAVAWVNGNLLAINLLADSCRLPHTSTPTVNVDRLGIRGGLYLPPQCANKDGNLRLWVVSERSVGERSLDTSYPARLCLHNHLLRHRKKLLKHRRVRVKHRRVRVE